MKSVIEMIQDDDPSYDPLTLALRKTPFVGRTLWRAACDRVFYDGYYGPISAEEWKEQDGRKPYSVKEAIDVIKKVLSNVEDYHSIDDLEDIYSVEASEIKKALIPFWREIYGYDYPS